MKFLVFLNWLDWCYFHKSYFSFSVLKIMSNKFIKFRDYINEQFLLYTWNNLKIDLRFIKNFEPIGKNWFKKTAFLLRKGLFIYSNFHINNRNFSNCKKNSLGLLKYKIIESAILNLIQLRLNKCTKVENTMSIKYVCRFLMILSVLLIL